MLTSILALYTESEYKHMKNVLEELKSDKLVHIKGLVHGQLFDKLTVSIFVLKENLQPVFDILVANDIEIFPYNEEYRKRTTETMVKLHKLNRGFEELLRANDGRDEENGKVVKSKAGSLNKGITGRLLPNKNKIEIDNKLKSLLAQFESSANFPENIDSLVKRGNYIAIRNFIKSNPEQKGNLKEKFIPAVINCIKRNMEAGLQKRSYVDVAILKLKDIINDKEIKTINAEYLVNLAANALITLCSQTDPEELIDLVNSPGAGKKINVMAAVKLSELIFETMEIDKTDESLLKIAANKVNVRFVLSSYDVMESMFAEMNKRRFNKLIDAINIYKKENP